MSKFDVAKEAGRAFVESVIAPPINDPGKALAGFAVKAPTSESIVFCEMENNNPSHQFPGVIFWVAEAVVIEKKPLKGLTPPDVKVLDPLKLFIIDKLDPVNEYKPMLAEKVPLELELPQISPILKVFKETLSLISIGIKDKVALLTNVTFPSQ